MIFEMFERTVPRSQLVGIWKEEYLPLCDLISKIRETHQYVNIGENRERDTGERELNSEENGYFDILYNPNFCFNLVKDITYNLPFHY